MFRTNQRWQPKTDEIASKVIDGEAIIINLANGVYYSMDHAGGFAWELVQQAHTPADIVSAVVARYDVSRDEAQADVERLLAELLHHGLIGPSESESAEPAPAVMEAEARLPYASPALNVYRDMGDLLALDPPTPGLDSPWKDSDEAPPEAG